MTKYLLPLLSIYLLAVNLIAFILLGADKRRAKKDLWRIKESTLFLPVLLGGSLGGTVGMHFFHHKTRHWYFRFGFPAILVLDLATAIWLYCTFYP